MIYNVNFNKISLSYMNKYILSNILYIIKNESNYSKTFK